MAVFFTVGHSTRSVEELAGLLLGSEVRVLVDVRSIPRSRTNPQFNQDVLPAALEAFQIGYRHLAALGGLRKGGLSRDESPNGYWRVESFRRYADYALGPEFAGGLAELRAIGREARPAIMCAEAVWWRCHRRIITDYLIAAGEEVRHILGPGHVEDASLTPGARVLEAGRRIEYPEEAAP